MINLETTYMGLQLKNPLIAASSGLTDSVDKIKTLAEDGIGAIVLKSLFEEQIQMEIGVNSTMFDGYTDDQNYVTYYTKEYNVNKYLTLIEESKKAVDVPIIASINCMSAGEWVDFAKKIESAGADAIELNMFILPSNTELTGEKIESVYFDLVDKITSIVKIPVALKISSYFSGMANTLVKLSNSGISSLVLFNRFYNPDIDLETETLTSNRIYSVPEENSNNLRWVGILSGKVNCDISSTTGIENGETAIKNILVGAKTVQIASTLYKNSTTYIGTILKDMESWLDSKNYKSLSEITGKLNASNIKHPIVFERSQFMKYYSNHH
ncbi:MAG: dihydroorotate dehydrogenase-like protein [Bacteroidota bacterium]|nr:dihydroorotate dehydrogenase-like protein [Bacteroidota bacterium]